MKAIQSPLRFDSCMEHEICFFNSTAQGKNISKVTSLSIHAGRNKEDKKRGIFPLPQRTKKKEESGRQGGGARTWEAELERVDAQQLAGGGRGGGGHCRIKEVERENGREDREGEISGQGGAGG